MEQRLLGGWGEITTFHRVHSGNSREFKGRKQVLEYITLAGPAQVGKLRDGIVYDDYQFYGDSS